MIDTCGNPILKEQRFVGLVAFYRSYCFQSHLAPINLPIPIYRNELPIIATLQYTFVLRWSEIFAEFEMRHSFLNDKLKLEQERLQKSFSSADQIVAMQDSSTASFPPEMAHS